MNLISSLNLLKGIQMAKEETQNTATFSGIFALIIWSLGACLIRGLERLPLLQIFTIAWSLGFLTTVWHLQRQGRWHILQSIPWHAWLVGISMLVINHAAYVNSYRFAPTEQVDLINYLWPVLVLLFTGFLPGERFSPWHLASALFGFSGIYILLYPELKNGGINFDYIEGYLCAIFACICWALYVLYSRFLKASVPSELLGLCCAPSAFFAYCGHISFEETLSPNTQEIVIFMIYGTLSSGAGYWLWDNGIKQGHFKLLNVLSYFTPILSVTWLLSFQLIQASSTLFLAYTIVVAASLSTLLVEKWQKKQVRKTIALGVEN
ncbi:MAG: hypothetical protein CMO81_02795 [Waddliaceae bacterium]|nr:hypothetical protein [Waddliaceae bacterium]